MTEILLINIFCILLLGVLLLGINLQRALKDKTTKRFSLLLFAMLSYVLFNLFSEAMEGKSNLSGLSFVFNLITFFDVDFVVMTFSAYLYALLEKSKRQIRKHGLFVIFMACLARIIMISVLAGTGNLFSIQNGYYSQEKWCFLPYLFYLCLMVFLLAVVIYNRKCFSVRQFAAILFYLILPIASVIVELYTDIYSLTVIAMTLSVVVIYTLIQADAIEKGKIRENLLVEISNTDLLTGLDNRRAYYERISKLNPAENLGVLFFDLNGLKYTNDHFGYASGDELIKKFASLLTGIFEQQDIFRISGDEFVVLNTGVSNADFTQKMQTVRNVIAENEDIASVGYAFGIGKCFERLITEAEEIMYRDKESYYGSKAGVEKKSARKELR